MFFEGFLGWRDRTWAYQFENDKEQVVDDKGPLAAVAITGDTKGDGADGTEHQDEGNTPGDVGLGFSKSFGQATDGKGDGKEVEGIPGLCLHGLVKCDRVCGAHWYLLTQAAKAMAKNAHCWALSMRTRRMGLGRSSMAGRKVVMRVLR